MQPLLTSVLSTVNAVMKNQALEPQNTFLRAWETEIYPPQIMCLGASLALQSHRICPVVEFSNV